MLDQKRLSALEMSPEDFKKAGYEIIDQLADFLKNIKDKPVTKGEKPAQIQKLLTQKSIPENGSKASLVLREVCDLLVDHSLFNGHPKFFGYITSSAAPIGALGDLIAAAINPNVGAYALSPVATEIEKQTIQWISEFIHYHPDCGGVLVSGGNMANFVGFLTGRAKKVKWDLVNEGIGAEKKDLVVYCPKGTHTWIEKATYLFGHGKNSIRWISVNEKQEMNTDDLESNIKKDLAENRLPFMVVGTFGSVGTGSIDPLDAISEICNKYDLWFHVDGAYGAPVAGLPEFKKEATGLQKADSIALDPHKWFYSPLEVGCVLVKNVGDLKKTFSFHPDYYNFDGNDMEEPVNFYEYGLQNSRGFRALKVWLSFKQIGRTGFIETIREDISLAKYLFDRLKDHQDFETVLHSLSITTFRFIETGLRNFDSDKEKKEFLNKLNKQIVDEIQVSGDAFLSNAIIDGKYCLRTCIVNFRTSKNDIDELIEIVSRVGRKLTHTS